ncbi:DNA ligase 1-like [Ylistrum balloti]|uniref:DNA ligase 1-like n=1 Tax=Ylistrum balloti TaxID=509963 RepID=UPI0029058260|nr:DNA ligase 1-like [Ylistrum balloti]
MRGKLLLGGGKPIAWNHNTSYVGASGLHSENSPPAIGRRRKEDHDFKEILTTIENMHRKDMQSFTTNRKYLEKSMLAYSERMREINKGRRSLPVIITPASGEKPVLPKKFSNTIRPDVASPASDLLGSSRDSVISGNFHLHSPLHSPRKLSPMSHSRNRNRKMTFHGSEIERHLLTPNMHYLRHSISGTATSQHSFASEGSLRTRKISTISPPDPSDIRRTRDTKSTDSAYESFNGSEMEYDQQDKHDHNNETDMDVHSVSSIKIACFPEIHEERKYINSMFGVQDEQSEDTPIQKKKKLRKVVKKPQVETKGKKNKYLKRQRKHEKKEKKEEIAETIIETYMEDDEKEEEQEEDSIEEPEKKKREVCFGFRYSLAIKELLKKPNPFNVSKKEMVHKVEMENGRIVNTLGPAVLKVVDVDRLNNIRGVPLNIKRDEPASKRKKAAANLSRSVSRNPLPSISRGVSVEGNQEDSEKALSERNRTKTSLYEKPLVSSHQSPSTVMVIGADG